MASILILYTQFVSEGVEACWHICTYSYINKINLAQCMVHSVITCKHCKKCFCKKKNVATIVYISIIIYQYYSSTKIIIYGTICRRLLTIHLKNLTLNIRIFYITLTTFYYYSNKKNQYKIKFFHFFIQNILTFFLH